MLASRGAWPAIVFVAAAAAVLPSGASADEPQVESVAVAYAAADRTCPPEDQFIRKVRRYTTKWAVAGPNASVRTFRVRLASRGGRFAGTLSVVTLDGKTTTREIVGPECDGVARGLVRRRRPS